MTSFRFWRGFAPLCVAVVSAVVLAAACVPGDPVSRQPEKGAPQVSAQARRALYEAVVDVGAVRQIIEFDTSGTVHAVYDTMGISSIRGVSEVAAAGFQVVGGRFDPRGTQFSPVTIYSRTGETQLQYMLAPDGGATVLMTGVGLDGRPVADVQEGRWSIRAH